MKIASLNAYRLWLFTKKRIIMETKYLLVLWPESQSFIGIKGCYYASCYDEDDDLELDQAMFVPEETYNKIMSNG